jgi:hypothetical protein
METHARSRRIAALTPVPDSPASLAPFFVLGMDRLAVMTRNAVLEAAVCGTIYAPLRGQIHFVMLEVPIARRTKTVVPGPARMSAAAGKDLRQKRVRMGAWQGGVIRMLKQTVLKEACIAVALISLSFEGVTSASPVCNLDAREITYSQIKRVIDDCRFTTIEEVLGALPQSRRSLFALVHDSRSRQGATPDFPRVILQGDPVTLAYNGSPAENGFYDLELFEFSRERNQFEFHNIHLEPGKPPQFSQTNPAECLRCHRQDPRPNWDTYQLWPGAFKADDDNLFFKEEVRVSAEQPLFKRFLKNKESPRYRGLSFEYYSGFGGTPNERLGVALSRMNAEKNVSFLLSSALLSAYRYALLGAIECSGYRGVYLPIEEFFPASVLAGVTRGYSDVLEETRRLNRRSYVERVTRHLSLLELSALEGTRTHRNFIGGGSSESSDSVARVRYTLETVANHNISEWSLEFGSRNYVFNDGAPALNRISTVLADKVWPGGKDGLFRTPRYCEKLRQKSIEALSLTR